MSLQPPDELPPIAMIVEMLEDALKQLEGVDELIRAHRIAAGEDHRTLERLQVAGARVDQAWVAIRLARTGLRS